MRIDVEKTDVEKPDVGKPDVEKQNIEQPTAYQKDAGANEKAGARLRAQARAHDQSAQKSPAPAEKQADSQGAQNDKLLQLAVGETRSIPGRTKNFDGGVGKLGYDPYVSKHTSNWDSVNSVAAIMIEGVEPGSTTVTWGGGKITQVEVS